MLFLLRFMATKAAVSSPFFILKPMDLRLCSPVSGGSTLVTTAPMSARTWQQNGPAITCVRSRTFSFSSGNIEPQTLHLAVAYAFDRGSLLLPFGWIITVRRHVLFRHLRRHRTRARMLFHITDELKKLEARRSHALLRL